MKDLVSDANFECSPTALSLQAMDTSHVALVSMTLRSDGFSHYRCDRNISMGGAWKLRALQCLKESPSQEASAQRPVPAQA